MDKHEGGKESQKCKWEYIGRTKGVMLYSDAGVEYCFDIYLYECQTCGEYRFEQE